MEQKQTDARPVTKDMTMGEIIQKWPAAGEIMQSYGLHCFGCHVNLFETLEQGIMGHGMSEEVMHDLLNDLNKMAGGSDVSPEKHEHVEEQNVSITEIAAEKLKDLLQKQGKAGDGIRVQVVRGGCSGFMYNMDFEKSMQPNDQVIDEHDVRLFIDSESFAALKGVVIDYVETLQGAGFKFDNPNAQAACGCGKSFH